MSKDNKAKNQTAESRQDEIFSLQRIFQVRRVRLHNNRRQKN